MNPICTAASILFALTLCLPANGGEYVIIVNPQNPIQTISKTELKRIYTGKIKEIKGSVVVPIDLPVESPAAGAFLKDIIEMSGTDYKEFWINQQVKGAGSAPMIQKSGIMVRTMISQLPGGIGYILESDLDESVKKIDIK